MRCEKCNGELNTACVCTKCGHYNPLPRPLITADPDPMRKHREHNPMSNVMEMRELKPCPFCGGVYPDDLSVDEDMVLCDACGCIGVRLSEWNTRYQPADWVAVRRDRLDEYIDGGTVFLLRNTDASDGNIRSAVYQALTERSGG